MDGVFAEHTGFLPDLPHRLFARGPALGFFSPPLEERLEEKNPILMSQQQCGCSGMLTHSLTHAPKTRVKIFLKL